MYGQMPIFVVRMLYVRYVGVGFGQGLLKSVLEKEAKAERIEVRVTPNVKALLMAAAQARHTTISDFLLNHGIEAAEQAIAAPLCFMPRKTGGRQCKDCWMRMRRCSRTRRRWRG